MKSWIVPTAFGGALTLWAIWVLQRPIFAIFNLDWSATTLGQWGDSFGALNALFAAAGFGAVLLTLRSQQRSLDLQQSQLASQQAELSQAKIDQYKQRFETTFFDMLRLLREARNDVRYRYSEDYSARKDMESSSARELHEGQEAFKAAMWEVRYWMRLELKANRPITKEAAGSLYRNKVHARFEARLGPYFRLIYSILNRIDTDPYLSKPEKWRYGNLLRSQLTSFEVSIAALNSMIREAKNFDSLIVRFRLLKYLPNGSLRRIFQALFPKEAFLERD